MPEQLVVFTNCVIGGGGDDERYHGGKGKMYVLELIINKKVKIRNKELHLKNKNHSDLNCTCLAFDV